MTARYHALSPTGPRMDTYTYRQPLGVPSRRARPQSYHGTGLHAAAREHEWNDIEQGRLHSVLQSLRRRQRTSRGTRSLDHEIPTMCGAAGDPEAENGVGIVREETSVQPASSVQRPRVHSRSSDSLTSTTDSCSELLGGAAGGKTESGINGRRLRAGHTGSRETEHYQHHVHHGDGSSHSTTLAEEDTPQMDYSRLQGGRRLEGQSSNSSVPNVDHRHEQVAVQDAPGLQDSTRSKLANSGHQGSDGDDDVSLLSL